MHAKVSAENKKFKIISFQLQSNTDKERQGKYVGFFPGNIIKRAFNLIEFNPCASSVSIVNNRTSIC